VLDDGAINPDRGDVHPTHDVRQIHKGDRSKDIRNYGRSNTKDLS
jgi:hypothetical protein